MREKIVLLTVLVLVCGGLLLWRCDGSADEYGAGKGCYSAPPGIGLPMGDATSSDVVPVDCAQPHTYEVIAVLKDDGAEDRCRREAVEFLGGPIETARATYALLEISDPVRGGLLCALAETSDTRWTTIGSTHTMKDGMRGERPLAITCVTGEDPEAYGRFVDCADSHAGELVGVVADGGQVEAGCRAAAAAYLGLEAGELDARGDIALRSLGDDHALCFVFEAEDPAGRHDTLRGSVKGLGTGPLPR